MKLKSVFSVVLILAVVSCMVSGCARHIKEEPISSAIQTENDIDTPTAAGADEESGIFCGDYSVPESGDEIDGDYSVVSSQIHLPNQEVDGDLSAATSAAAPLKEDYRPDYATSKLTESELEAENKDKQQVSSGTPLKDSYTLTYGCVATYVPSGENVTKMKSFLQETCKYWCLVDWVKKPEAICTVELGGNRYSLVEYYMVENLEMGGGAYIMNRQELETFRNILEEAEVLADSIDAAISEAINNVENVNPTDTAEHSHTPAKTAQTVSDPISGYCGNIITKVKKDGAEVSFWGGDSVALTDLVINLNYSEPMCKCAAEFEVYAETEKEPYEVNLSQSFVRFGDKHAPITADQVGMVREIIERYFLEEEKAEIIVEKPQDIPVSSPAQG